MNKTPNNEPTLVITEYDITTCYGRPTYYYRGVEIGHRQHVIKKLFPQLRELIFEETGKIITEVYVMTTTTGSEQIKIPCGSLTCQPSTKAGYNVCGRIKFSDGTFGSGDMWVYHRRSTSVDGAAVYCAQHFMNEAINNSYFRQALVSKIIQSK